MESFWPVFFLCVGITYGTRVLPFLVFRKGELPDAMVYLGKVLPYAIMGLLVVYALRGVKPLSYPFGIPEAIASVFVVFVHARKRNMMISILGGTIVYMILLKLM